MIPRSLALFGCLLLCALVAPGPAVSAALDPEAGLPFLDAFTPRDYRGHQQVWKAVEDRDGLLYFGNLNKVLIFDGARWTHLDVPDATFIRGLALDDDDTLWIGGVDELGYARRDETGARTFVSLKDQLPADARAFGDIWAVHLTRQGVIYQSASWLFRWDGARFTQLALPSAARWRSERIGANVWLTNAQTGWFRLEDRGETLALVEQARPPGVEADRLVGAAPASEAWILLTGRHGLWRWDGVAYTRLETDADPVLIASQPYSLQRLTDGRLVVCSLEGGMFIFDAEGHLLTHLDDTNGLLDNTAISAYAARDGRSLWTCLARGVVRVDIRPWLSWFQTANGLPRGKLFAALRHQGRLFAPADSGGLMRLVPATPGRPATFERVEAAPRQTEGVFSAEDSLVLTGTNGAIEWNETGPSRPLPGATPNSTSFIALKQRPGTWALLNNDEVRLYQRGPAGWTVSGPLPGIQRVRSLVEDTDGSWWHGRPAGGVLHTRFVNGPDAPPVVDELTAPTALPVGHGWIRYTKDHRGPLMMCNLGLFRYDPAAGRFMPCADYGPSLADGSTYVYGATPDNQEGLWMILRPPNEPEASNDLRLAYGHAGRLTPLHIPQLAAIDDAGHFFYETAAAGRPETLWVSGHGALVRIDITQWRKTTPTPAPVLGVRAVAASEGRRLALGGNWTLPFSDRSLRIVLSAPALAADPSALYETTLDSISGTEARRDSVPERDFSALGVGRYTLTARARHAGGPWSEPVVVRFTVLPPWWLSLWSLAAYAMLGATLLAVLWRRRTQHWLRQQHALETAVAARTMELAAQNEELVRLRKVDFDEKLAARLAEHKARLEVLRYQLNPHFLFNTLTSICSQIIHSPRQARDTVIRLAEFCRLTLHRPDEAAEPTLGEEIEMLRAYLDIEHTRLGDLFDYSISCDTGLAGLRLPPFLLLPLVENAVKYGAATSRDRVRIRLSVHRDSEGRVTIEVANSGAWIPPEQNERSVPSLGIGLENLRQRLARYFPGRHEFTTEPADGWVVARLRLTDST